MRIAVLLSASLHPVSGQPALSRVEAQAVTLGLELRGELFGFHAGPNLDAARAALGHGLQRLVHLPLPEGADPVPVLGAELARFQPDLVLAGPRSVGGDETGLVPYRLAEALDMPILADAVDLRPTSDGFEVASALPKGERLMTRQSGPLVLTLHPAAPAARAYAFAQERRGRIETRDAVTTTATEERPVERLMRLRAKVKAVAAGGSAADRLRAATETTSAKGGQKLVDPDPEMAARAILDHLRAIGAVPAKRTRA
ncbi:hypothetical protein [Aureimonas sp. AU20]|uniref:hypothetical protein n=1 Tax=Aureimonas sp. AU20 TaxID=1349819 RepID=UPI000721F2E1|nr:hypothetical protein [Aureimonas sp. AU20]ALN72921.1 hypothetical protein M673_09345 [Aureimonas sp. AU20]